MLKAFAGALAGFLFVLPAQAQSSPSDQDIQGRVVRLHGGHTLSVDDANGNIDTILLHQGTIINPTGLTLLPGMIVRISGQPAGNAFTANEIDTPYQVIDGFAYYGGRLWDGPQSSSSPDFSDAFDGSREGADRDGHHGGRGGGHDHSGGDHGTGGGADGGGGGGGGQAR